MRDNRDRSGKWRILILHNAYQERGGEDSVVAAEMGLLTRYGHEVEIYRRHNDELLQKSAISAAADALWSRQSSADLRLLVQRFAPDLVHVHNTFPLISPSVYWQASALRIPVVQTLHNFRLMCPQAQLLRNGAVCEACVGKLPWRAVAYGCYRGSRLQSAVSAVGISLHRAIGTYDRNVTRYIALNEFCRLKFIEAGLPPRLICIKPNFVEAATQIAGARSRRQGGLFVCRLSLDKGVLILLSAISALEDRISVTVIGSGQLEGMVAERLGDRYVGFKSLPEILELMRSAAYLIVPSIWYENFPRTIVEAFASGLPVIASRLGALAEVVKEGQTGLLFDPGQASDLAEKLRWAEANPLEMLRMGRNARKEYEELYSPERNYEVLSDIYSQALSERAGNVGDNGFHRSSAA